MTAAATLPRGTAPTLARIPLDQIDTADNVRTSIDPAADAELAESIKALGILQPVTLWETPLGRYQVRYGHRRVRAARLAGLTHVPAIVSEDQALETRVSEQLVENLQRSDLSALEEAKALRAILDAEKGLTQAALAQRIGRSAPWVANTLGLLRLPEHVQQLLADGKMDASHCKALAGLPAKDQNRLADDAVAQGWSAHTLEQQAKWRREQQADQVKRAKGSEAAATRAIEALTAADTPKDASLHVRVPWSLDGETVRAAIAAAGWSVVEGWTHDVTEGCDCPALLLDVKDGKGSSTITRACVSEEHRKAAWERGNAERVAADKVRQAEAEQLRGAIVDAVMRSPGDRTVLRLVLRRLDGYSAKPWALYVKRSDLDVVEALAAKLTTGGYDQTPVPAKTVIKALATGAADAEA